MAYRLSRDADRDVYELFLFGAERFGVEQAERYHTDLAQAFDLIGRHPWLAPERHDLGGARVHTHRSHAVIYDVGADGGVLILRVLHTTRDWRRHL
ncbi:type II toxin-antitoxin system RelE/ParE family toxin [Methylopila musalis]|uniref:Type II toxin-antitoxin system RelE/ParE family toxin n=1 Tax=Methylopila musalis TaxID=1134781 RepID=A0ABW3Z696_9HYPH